MENPPAPAWMSACPCVSAPRTSTDRTGSMRRVTPSDATVRPTGRTSMPSIQELLDRDFATIPDLIAVHAQTQPAHLALVHGDRRIDYATLDTSMNRVAAALQRDGARARDTI